MIVIASIHQPSLETLAQFTNVMFLAEGKTCYFGRVDELDGFFERWGRPVGRYVSDLSSLPSFLIFKIFSSVLQMTPSDHAMNFLNSDFGGQSSSSRREEFRQFYLSTISSPEVTEKIPMHLDTEDDAPIHGKAGPLATLFWNTWVLAERAVVNYKRNLLAYGVRAGMYCGMGLMLA